LIALREELAAAEAHFEAQYREIKGILDDEISKTWAQSEEQFRKMRAELPQLELSEVENPEAAAKLRSGLDEAIEKARTTLTENEAKARKFLTDAEHIIVERHRA
jgi:hypothetical protein